MPATHVAYVAKGTIYPCRFVKSDATNAFGVVQASTNEGPLLGIAQEGANFPNLPIPGTTYTPVAATTGQNLQVFQDGEEAILELGSGGATVGALLKSDSNGKGVIAATTNNTAQNIGAIALQAGSDTEFIRVLVKTQYKVYPALS